MTSKGRRYRMKNQVPQQAAGPPSIADIFRGLFPKDQARKIDKALKGISEDSRVDTPKAERKHQPELAALEPIGNPVAVLGHTPRGRTGRGKGRRR